MKHTAHLVHVEVYIAKKDEDSEAYSSSDASTSTCAILHIHNPTLQTSQNHNKFHNI